MRRARIPVTALTAVVVLALAAPHAAAPARDAALPDRHPCLRLRGHAYEVCSAYVLNASLAARVPFYRYGRSTAPGYYEAIREGCTGRDLGAAVTCRMWSRYYGSARGALADQVRGWPDDVDVARPRIRIVGVRSGPAPDSSLLRTVETWLVRAGDGRVLFRERARAHTIALSRVRGILLHKWVVTSISGA